MSPLSLRGLGHSYALSSSSNNAFLSGPVRPALAHLRSACRPVALLPAPRSPSSRRQRARLVTRNFKQSDSHSEEAPVVRPKPVRHPITEDPFAGASPADTATQEVLLRPSSIGAAAAAAAPKARRFLGPAMDAAYQAFSLVLRPRALLRAIVRNTASYGWQVVLAYFALAFLREPLLQFWESYCAALESHPLPTKVATGLVASLIGDYVAQLIGHRDEVNTAQQRGEAAPAFTYDVVRTARLALYGAAVGTPIGHAWFKFLDANIMPDAMTSPTAVLSKMLLDQLLMSPLSTALFFILMRCWEGHPQDALAYMRVKMVPTMKANYILWPIAHIVNFGFVPPEQRILYCNAVGVVWTIIMSTIANAKVRPEAGPAAAAAAGRSSGPMPGGGGASKVGSGGWPPVMGSLGGVDAGARHSGVAQREPASPGFSAAEPAAAFSSGADLGGGSQMRGRGAAQPAMAPTAYMRLTKQDGSDA